MVLRDRTVDLIWIVLLVAGIVCFSVGNYLSGQATVRDLNGYPPHVPDFDKLRHDQLPGVALVISGLILGWAAGMLLIYSLTDRKDVVARRKPEEKMEARNG